MTLDSLNNNNKSEEKNVIINKIMTGTGLPGYMALAVVVLGFFAVLNSNFFYFYFYESYGYFISFLIAFLAQILFLLNRRIVINSTFAKYLIAIIVLEGYCALSALLSEGGYRYLGTVFNTVGITLVISQCKIKKSFIKKIFRILIITAIVCVLIAGNYYEKQYSMYSVNSNYVALFGLVILIYGNLFLTYIIEKENRKTQLIRVLLCISSIYIILQCQSRGALFAWIFYVVSVYIIPQKFFLNRKRVLCLTAAIAVFGIGFTYIYVNNLNTLISTFMGKSTATRYRLWSYFWENIGNDFFCYLFGYGTHSALREYFGYGLHNIYIGIWYDIGIIGLLLFMIIDIWSINNAYGKNSLDVAQTYALIGFLSFMVNDYFAVTFTGPLIVWNYAMLGFVQRKKVACHREDIMRGRIIFFAYTPFQLISSLAIREQFYRDVEADIIISDSVQNRNDIKTNIKKYSLFEDVYFGDIKKFFPKSENRFKHEFNRIKSSICPYYIAKAVGLKSHKYEVFITTEVNYYTESIFSFLKKIIRNLKLN